MLLYALDATHHNPLQAEAERLDGFHFQPGHGKPVGNLIR
jgi:hypothetical protein